MLIATLPGSGTLTDNGVALSAGTLVAAADIAAGKLVYTPATNSFGMDVASFSFAVENSGGTADGGEDTSAAATATIYIGQINKRRRPHPSSRRLMRTSRSRLRARCSRSSIRMFLPRTWQGSS